MSLCTGGRTSLVVWEHCYTKQSPFEKGKSWCLKPDLGMSGYLNVELWTCWSHFEHVSFICLKEFLKKKKKSPCLPLRRVTPCSQALQWWCCCLQLVFHTSLSLTLSLITFLLGVRGGVPPLGCSVVGYLYSEPFNLGNRSSRCMSEGIPRIEAFGGQVRLGCLVSRRAWGWFASTSQCGIGMGWGPRGVPAGLEEWQWLHGEVGLLVRCIAALMFVLR